MFLMLFNTSLVNSSIYNPVRRTSTMSNIESFEQYIREYDLAGSQSWRGRLVDTLTSSDTRLLWTLNYLFKECDLYGARVLDIGAGSGVQSLYAATAGAAEVVALEPMSAGSEGVSSDQLRIIADERPEIEVVSNTFQDYQPADVFDVIFSKASINHLNEEHCRTLHNSTESRKAYDRVLSKLASMTSTGGRCIVSDASSRNFFNDLGLPNPIAPNIDWEIHQSPQVWRTLFAEHGFTTQDVRWYSSFSNLGGVAEMLITNKLASYMTNSHFVLTMERSK